MSQNNFERASASLQVDGATVTYHSAGQAVAGQPLLLMVHGSTGSTDSHYGYLFPMLSFGRRVVSVDLARPAGSAALQIDQLVRQVSAVLDAVSPGRPVCLMGYSLGAVVCAALAAGRPEAIRQLVLVAGWMKTDGHQRLRNSVWQALRAEGSAALRRYMVFCAFSADFIAARTPDELQAMADKITLDEFVDAQMALNAGIDISARVPHIRAATLVVGCTHDQMVPKGHSQQLFGAIDDARYAQIDAGHAVVFERPAELLRLVDNFLRAPQAWPAGALVPAARP